MSSRRNHLRGRVLVVDNYDSFTFNLVQHVGELGAQTAVVRNDAMTVAAVVDAAPDAILLSPGPGRPEDAGICVDLVLAAARASIPMLGVCLGHQAVALAFGARVIGATVLMHGKCSDIEHAGEGVFRGLPSPLRATRYHSLVVDRATLPPALTVTAWTAEGTLMGVRHRDHLIEGVQFHPESVGTPLGRRMLATLLDEAGVTRRLRAAS